MNEIEKAKELFKKLEEKSTKSAAEIAKRAFCIQEIISN